MFLTEEADTIQIDEDLLRDIGASEPGSSPTEQRLREALQLAHAKVKYFCISVFIPLKHFCFVK